MVNYEFDCCVCAKHVVRRVSQRRLNTSAPKYCSNVCKFKNYRVDRKEITCEFCKKTFKRYVAPGAHEAMNRFCSRSCQIKQMKIDMGQHLSSSITTNCLNCDVQFTYNHKLTHQLRKYCSRLCSSSSQANKTHNGYRSLLERWTEKFGVEEAQRMFKLHKQRRSENSTKANTGRILSPESRAKISSSCIGISNVLKGKTFEEFYGIERARELGDQHSEVLREGFASGRLKPINQNSRQFIRGTYKGVKFKSSFEYGFMKMIEASGYVIGQDVLYEPIECRVVYEIDNKSHTYFPDFLVVSEATVYEIKPEFKLNDPDVIAKRLAASTFLPKIGLKYKILTENDLQGYLFNRKTIYADPDVVSA